MIRIMEPVDGDEVYQIVLDEIAIATCGDLVTAFGLMMATYYSFNIAYPKELNSSLVFFQKAFLNIRDSANVKKVTNLMCRLLAKKTQGASG